MWCLRNGQNNKHVSLCVVLVCALVIACGGGPIWGQVQISGSRGLDANPRVGSGGRNPAASGYSSLGNQIISGNVGGGKSFKGLGGTRDFNQFQGSLGSGSLSSFRRDSYGLSGNAGRLGVAQQFFLPSSTVLGVRGITQGLNRPGSTIPKNVNLGPATPSGPAISRGLTGVAPSFAALSPADLRADLRTIPQVGGESSGPIVETASNLFGIRRLSPGLGVTAEAERRLDVTREIRPAAVPDQTRTGADVNQSFQALPTWARAGALGGEESGQFEGQNLPSSLDQENLDKNLQEARELIDQSAGSLGIPSMVDIYEQMMAESNAEEQISPNTTEGTGEASSPIAPYVQGDTGGTGAQPGAMLKMPSYGSFVGSRRSSFNDYMAQGESLLKNRLYYQAATAYKRARELRPENPLAYLGRAYSLTGAGDLISAADSLGKALEIFPEQSQRNIDLPQFFYNQDELKRITTKLSALADVKKDNARIRLLLGYIYHYSGQNNLATPILAEATELAKKDTKIPKELASTIAKFSEAVSKQVGKSGNR